MTSKSKHTTTTTTTTFYNTITLTTTITITRLLAQYIVLHGDEEQEFELSSMHLKDLIDTN